METEARQKESLPAISPLNVMSSFEEFEKKAMDGFTTQEENLASYGKFLATCANFFKQSGIGELPETRDLVDKLFYQHANTAVLPIDFFLRAKERLDKEVLNNSSIRPSQKTWSSELSLIRDETQKEAGITWQNFTKEKQMRERLEQLTQEKTDFVQETNLSLSLSSIGERKQYIQKTAIDLLSKNQDVGFDIKNIRNYQQALLRAKQPDALPDPDKIREILNPHSEFLKAQTEGELPPIDDLYTRSAIGQESNVEAILISLENQAKNPDFVWQHLVRKGYLPKEILDGFEDLTALTELQETANFISEMPKNIKAKHLLPFLKRGVSAGILTEIVEGRYDLPDDLIARQIDSLIHFWDTSEKQKSQKEPWSLKRKLVTAATVGMAVAIIASTPYIKNAIESNKAVAEARQMIEERPQEEEDALYFTEETDSIKPQNGSVGGFKKNKKIVLWNVSGKNRRGFYREMTASQFDEQNKTWLINKGFLPEESTALSDKFDITLSHTGIIRRRTVNIPTKNNYSLPADGIRIQGNNISPVNVAQRTDGTFVLNFSENDIDKIAKVTYSLGKSDNPTTPMPSQKELQNMRKKLVDISELPEREREFVTKLLQRNALSTREKAKELEEYVKSNLRYSLLSSLSDVYHSAEDNKEFLDKIFLLKSVDCDVANTALVALLRSANIPSRMAYGFANTGGFLDDNDKKLVATEGHGWVEAYIDRQWISLDGTPSSMDFYTRSELKGDMELLTGLSKKDMLTILEGILALEIINAGLFGVSTLLRRRNEKLALKLKQEVENRANNYFGSGFEETRKEIEKTEYSKVLPYKWRLISTLIPPFGLIALGQGGFERYKTWRVSHRYSKGELLTPSSEPDYLEFLTKVLGYKEDEARKQIYNAAYQETKKKIREQSAITWFTIMGQLHLPFSFLSAFDGLIIRKMSHYKSTLNEQNYPQIRKEIIDSFYDRYQKEQNKRESSIALHGESAHMPIPPNLTIEELGYYIDILISDRLVRGQVNLIYEKAIKSLHKERLHPKPHPPGELA